MPCHKRMYRTLRTAFADVTHLTMTEFEKTWTSPTTHLWLMCMDMVMILKRHIHAERMSMEGTPGRSRKDVAILLYPVSAGHCNYVSCLPRSQPDYPSIICEEQEMVNISTGHKAKSADLVRACEKGMGTTLVAARETGSEKLST